MNWPSISCVVRLLYVMCCFSLLETRLPGGLETDCQTVRHRKKRNPTKRNQTYRHSDTSAFGHIAIWTH